MSFRILFAAPLILILLAADARSGQLRPSIQLNTPFDLKAAIQTKRLVAGHLGSKPSATSLNYDRRWRDARPLPPLAFPGEAFRTGKLQSILENVSRRGEAVFPPHGGEIEPPFQYLDYLQVMRLERQSLRRTPASSSIVVLPLPASGWLLGTAVFCGLLFGKGRQRAHQRHRRPLRYRTV